MIRKMLHTSRRAGWLPAALIPLSMAACGGGKSKTADVVQTPAAPPSAPVVPAAGPTESTGPGATVSRPVSYEDAEAEFKAGRFAEAKTLFTSYVESKPDNAFGWYMLGLASWKSGDLKGAEEAFDTALDLNPKHVKSLLNSARVLMDLDRNQEALERVNQAQSLDSTSAEAIRLLARAQQRLGHIEEAITSYREALVRDESDVWAMNNLGMLYLEQKDPQSALGPLARAVQLKPGSPIFQNNLGMALELTGHVLEARRAYEDAVKADSSYAKSQANARRLSEVVVDSTKAAGVNVKDLAEEFRQEVKLWKDSVKPPTG